MHILVTGATGFIGRAVVEEALARGHEVTALVRDAQKAQELFSAHRKGLHINIVPSLDVFEPQSQYDRLIHLAWDGGYKYADPNALLMNLNLQFSFLSRMIKAGISDITVAGTCQEYGMREGKLSEEMEPAPGTYYALAKVTLYNMLRVLQEGGADFRLKWLRYFYVYGENQRSSSLYPQLLSAIARKDQNFDMSPGDQERDFFPVENLARNTLAIAEQTRTTGIINVGSGRAQKVADFARDIMRKKGHEMTLNCGHYPYPAYEPFSFYADVLRLREIEGADIPSAEAA